MRNRPIKLSVVLLGAGMWTLTSCVPQAGIVDREVNATLPETFVDSVQVEDTISSASISWKEYFTDEHLQELIDTALVHNQELGITMQQMRIYQNEIRAKQGEYLPFVDVGAGAGVEKTPRYTRDGAVEENLPIAPNTSMPDPLPDMGLGLYANWEIDIWHKLRDAKDAAAAEYLASVEAKNFMVTNLIAEVANTYYELMALDNQLAILKQNIEIQTNALQIVKLQKQAAKVTELAVRKFEAEVYHTQSLLYDVQQEIVEAENKMNFLLGRFPQPIERSSIEFMDMVPDTVKRGIPSELLRMRPDVRQAEFEMQAAELNVEVARKNFYPSLSISAGMGLSAYNAGYLFTTPESILYNIAGELGAPLFNRRGITAMYYNANAQQIQSIIEYERTILNAYVEVSNQLSKIDNLQHSYELKSREVDALTSSITISSDLFKSARADYMEVLMTQRDALESKFELIETKREQMSAVVNVYRALGGGWE